MFALNGKIKFFFKQSLCDLSKQSSQCSVSDSIASLVSVSLS